MKLCCHNVFAGSAALVLGLPHGVEPVPLFDYNCTGGDLTLGPRGWTPKQGGPCRRTTTTGNGAYSTHANRDAV